MKNIHLPQFVLDCSVTMTWCFEDEITPYAENIMDSLSITVAIVPVLWTIEVANILALAERKKRISHAKAHSFSAMLEKLPIRIEESISSAYLETIYRLAKENHLTAYDAVYLDLALQYNLPIATLDQELKKAAGVHGIELFQGDT
jgi:predicted nucleic acid-binding protein